MMRFFKNARVHVCCILAILIQCLLFEGCAKKGITVNDKKIQGCMETSIEENTDVTYITEENADGESVIEKTTEAKEWEVFLKKSDEILSDIRAGINIGNTLDSFGNWINGQKPEDYETAWGNPEITREYIMFLKSMGFNAVRLPVTYLHHIDENGNIDEQWLFRVKEVVDYIITNDMYCIINIHHDTGDDALAWLSACNDSTMKNKFKNIWINIANEFISYDEHLMFEGFNEILSKPAVWENQNMDILEPVNILNQLFVDTVRSTGGNNASRTLIVNTYGASSHESQVSGFVLPKDSIEGRLIVGVHIYAPVEFCNGKKMNFEESDKKEIDIELIRAYEQLKKKYSVPVIIGEFGARRYNDTEEYYMERAKYTSYFKTKALEYGIKIFFWEDGGDFKLFDRQKLMVTDKYTVDALVK